MSKHLNALFVSFVALIVIGTAGVAAAQDADGDGYTVQDGDCDDNELPDACEIAQGTATDANANGTLDVCEPCGGLDLDGTGSVGFEEMIQIVAALGPCPETGACLGDVDGDRTVGFNDLAIVVGAWGPCD